MAFSIDPLIMEAAGNTQQHFLPPNHPQAYKLFIDTCRIISGDGRVGTNIERLNVLDDENHVIGFCIIGGDRSSASWLRIRDYSSCDRGWKHNGGFSFCRFKRMFIAFDECIRGFSFYRPLLYLDEAPLTYNFEGYLFPATGKDGNNGLYPLCYAVVDSEDNENWHWFLLQLRRVLRPPRKMTFLNDRNIDLMDALLEVFTDADHSYLTDALPEMHL